MDFYLRKKVIIMLLLCMTVMLILKTDHLFGVEVTVQLKNSSGELIDAGTVQYYDGGWIDFGETSGGVITGNIDTGNYKFRMTYANGSNEKYQDIGEDPVVIFQTVCAEVQLKNSQGVCVDRGTVHYYSGGWHDFGTTSNGSVNMELLPNNYKFRMTYAFGSNEKYQDIEDDPVVVFQTINAEVRLIDSESVLLDTGTVQYYSGGWHEFGVTSGGSVHLELLPNNTKFRMTYAYASNEKYQQTGDDPIVVFQTVQTKVQLINSHSVLLDTGTVQYYAGGWHPFGTTSDGGTTLELLPNNTKFRMTYAFASNEKYQNIGDDPTVIFNTVEAVVAVSDANSNPITGAVVKYYSGGWRDFGTTSAGKASKELLPKNYKFRVTYDGETAEMYQDLSVAPDVEFQLDVVVVSDLILTVTHPASDTTTTSEVIFVSGNVSDKDATVTINGQPATVSPDSRFILLVSLTEGPNAISVVATSAAGTATETRTVTREPLVLPPDPSTVAPPVDQTVITTMAASTNFLYTADDPIQTNVDTAAMNPVRAAVIRGKVLSFDGDPLSGVQITILNHPEFGQTLSRTDGWFDMAVNGGGYLTVNYEKENWLPAQRQVDVPWQDYPKFDTWVL